ncbi:MAG: hypothetical protein CMK59_12055 [Proteobacteria bacterium]|nr:hypothetical protein [Pseudomonadota bacterium]
MKKLKKAVCYTGDRIKGSRFIANLIPITERSDVVNHLALLREEHSKATHICFAWRIVDGSFSCSDDGEPKGSAGLPILRHLEGFNLIDVLAVVVRYYGGTKLGIGGLIRAYGGAVSEALRLAEIEEFVERKKIKIEVDYANYRWAKSVCQQYEIQISNIDFGEKVLVDGLIPLKRKAGFLRFFEISGEYRFISCLIE